MIGAMISALAFAVAALATARITRLITADYLTEPARRWAVLRLGIESRLSYLITCQWCTSVWVAAAVAPAVYWWWHHAWVQVPAMMLAFSQIAGWFSRGEVE